MLIFCLTELYAQELSIEAIEVIEVKAHRKLISTQKMATSIDVITYDDIARSLLSQTSDLQFLSPGLSNGDFNLGQPQYYIRGIGSNADNASADSSISYYYNGLYIGRPAGQNVPLFDLQHVEILKGPQGTYLGKSALAGSILLYSSPAEFEDTGYLSLGLLSRNGFDLKGMINIESGDFANRVALYHIQQDGYVTNYLNNDTFSSKKSLAIRWSTVYSTINNNEHRIIATYNHDSPTNNGVRTIGGIIGNSNNTLYPKLNNNPWHSFEIDREPIQRTIKNITYQYSGDIANYGGDLVIGGNCFDFSHLDNPLPGVVSDNYINVLNDVMESSCQIGTNLSLYSKETDWVLGVYIDSENTERQETGIFEFSGFIIDGGTFQKNNSFHYSFFAANEYKLHLININYGARIGKDKKSVMIRTTSIDGQFIKKAYKMKEEYRKYFFTPHIHLSYFTENKNLVYLSLSTGYKAGGFSPGSTLQETQKPFDNEKGTSAELGYKWKNHTQNIQFNSAVFYSKFDDLQILVQKVSPGQQLSITRVENAAKSHSYGIESTLKMYYQNFSITASFAYLRAVYDEYANRTDIINNTLRNAPKYSMSFQLNYFPPSYAGWEWLASFASTYQSKRYQDAENYEPASIPSYGLANTTLVGSKTNYQIKVGIKNLFNKKYLAHSFASPTGVGTLGVFPSIAEPRSFFVEYQYSW